MRGVTGILPDDSVSPRDLLEPDAEKLARPVLRGPWRSNAPGLPDTRSGLPGGHTTVELHHRPATLVLRVTDEGACDRAHPSFPRPRRADAGGGRGLPLVERLADYWEWESNPVGVSVRAVFSRSRTT